MAENEERIEGIYVTVKIDVAEERYAAVGVGDVFILPHSQIFIKPIRASHLLGRIFKSRLLPMIVVVAMLFQ